MKKIVLAAALCSSFLFAGNSTEEFFYQSGYDQGQKDGFDKGVREAFKVAKKVLDEYKEEIRAYEIGKYLVKDSYLTAPKVYQSLGDAGETLKIQVMKSRIEKELDIKDIFSKFGTIPTLNEQDEIGATTRSIDQINSVNIASRDDILNLPAEAVLLFSACLFSASAKEALFSMLQPFSVRNSSVNSRGKPYVS